MWDVSEYELQCQTPVQHDGILIAAVNGGKASSGSPLRCLSTGIQRCRKPHLPSHCCSRRRERFPGNPVSHLPTPCRHLGCLKASWMALGTCVWAAEPAPGGQTAEQGWPWASRRIQLREHRFLVLLCKPWPPHGGAGIDPEGPLSQPLAPSRGHCPFGVLDGNSFLQAAKPSTSPIWKGSLDTRCSGRLLRTDTHMQVPSSGVELQSWSSRGKLY